LRCEFRSEPAVGQPQIQDHKVRPGTPRKRDRLGNGAGDAAYLVTMLDEDLFREIRQHEVVFNNQDLEHALSSSRRRVESRAAEFQSFLLNGPRPGSPKNARPQLLNLGIEHARPLLHGFNRPSREWFPGLFDLLPQSMLGLAVE
jgi:hypothetical protein